VPTGKNLPKSLGLWRTGAHRATICRLGEIGAAMNTVDSADVERALLHIRQIEERILEQRVRIDHLRQQGVATGVAEDLLGALVGSLELLKVHLGRITAPKTIEEIEHELTRDPQFVA
jgi:hypothetical protein